MTTLEQKKERLASYYNAEKAVLSGQSYRIGTRSLTRADLVAIQAAIEKLEKQILSLENGCYTRTRRVIPRDL